MMTGKMTTIARPYAIAAFEYASAHDAQSAWQAALDAAAHVTQTDSIQQLLTNPSVTKKQITACYLDVLAPLLNAEMINFIQLLAEYNRLSLLPDIANLFQLYCAAEEKKLTVHVVSAVDLDNGYKQTLIDALSKRLQRQVSLECSIDTKLLGGAVITAGDTVIDGSVRGKLNRMVEFISGISLR
jgi:F-type H+-transporting ATPase subunit delta